MRNFFFIKKLLVFSGLAIFASLFLSFPAQAAYTFQGLDPYGQSLREPALNLEQFNLFNLDYTGRGLTKLLIGIPRTSRGVVSVPTAENPQDYGAFGKMSMFLASMYTAKPVSGIEYFANLGRDFGLVKPAYAQGGVNLLSPIQTLWVISRNLAYLAFVLIFVLIGFMIMLRARIDPRTVATVQAAIPGIILSLILVTLSFALAGLVIDVARVATQLIANALAPVLDIDLQVLRDRNIFVLFIDLLGLTGDAAQSIVTRIIAAIPGDIATLIGVIGESGIGEAIIGFIFGILVVFTAFRVFIMLLTALVTIILLTIGAPFMFLVAAIPGRGGAVVGWFRSILSAALTFPLTFLLLALAAVFLGFEGQPWNLRPGGGVPGFNIDLVPFGRFEPGVTSIPIAQIIGLGILLLTPRVSDMIREAFAQRVPEWAGEPGRAIGGVVRRFVPFV